MKTNNKNMKKTRSKKAEKILKHKKVKGQTFYFVKWLNFGDEHNTWEPRDGFLFDKIVSEYEEKIDGSQKNPQQSHSSENISNNCINKDDDSHSSQEESIKPPKKTNLIEKNKKSKKRKLRKIEEGCISSQKENKSQPSQISESKSEQKEGKKHKNLMKGKQILKRSRRLRKPVVKADDLITEKNIRQIKEENRSEGQRIEYGKKIFQQVMQYQRVIGKEVIFQFKMGKERFFRLRLQNNEILTLRDDKMKMYFPRLLADHYRRILTRFTKEG